MVEEGALLWKGSEAFVERSNITRYMRWLTEARGLEFADYDALLAWSLNDLDAFWRSIWDYFEVIHEGSFERAFDRTQMPGVRWFDGTRLNYAEHVLRWEAERGEETVLHHFSEIRPLEQMSWSALAGKVRVLATKLRAMGIGSGDRVVAYMPNIVETMIAMLATTAIGAVWSSAAPEFGVKTVVDRFSQIRPKLVFAVDGYRFAGKDFDRRAEIGEIVSNLDTVEQIVWLSYLDPDGAVPEGLPGAIRWQEALAGPAVAREDFAFERVPCDHPLWILFSSGTTGLPKPIVHGHQGIVVEHLKTSAFHLDLKPSSCMYFYSTTGWVMWNSLPYSMIQGGASVLYDGSPSFPRADIQWEFAEKAGVTSFGTNPTFVQLMRKGGVRPGATYDLSALENIFLAGSPSTPETFAWLYEEVKADLWVTSQSGGTEFASGLVGGVAILPVYAGEIQARTLGVDVRVFDEDGREAPAGEVGELVIAAPMPSMPLFFWGDENFKRYREAYFEHFPGVWRHGDFMRINARGGCFVQGRSDATLNRFGVRIGSAEIYRTMETIEAVADSLIICIEEPGGGYYMPLFVQLNGEADLDEPLRRRIVETLRRERSPRHVPDVIVQAPSIPYTLSRKKMEVPVRKLLMGATPGQAFSRDASADPAVLDWFVEFAAARRAAATAKAAG